jgi:SepF-like predicted cell division protein (DUF552 family)
MNMKSWLPFPWGKTKKSEEESFDVEKYIKGLGVSKEGFIEEEGVIYVKSVNLDRDNAVEETAREIDKGNIVIVNMREMMHNPIALNEKVREIRDHCVASGGDMCRISEIKIMAIPKGMAIVYPAAEEAAA